MNEQRKAPWQRSNITRGVKPHRRSVLLAAMVMAVVAACGGGDGDSTDAASDPGGEPSTTEATVAGTPDTEASFVYGYYLSVSRLDPHQAMIPHDGTALFPAYDRLVGATPEGEFIPGLAESWEFSDDLLTLTLNLRPDVTFHDGATLDAEAVKANLERVKSFPTTSNAADLEAVTEVTVVDPLTVELTLSTPNVAVIGALADRAGAIVSPQALAGGVNLDEQMVGAGPFKLVDHVAGSTTRFERFEDYWDQENLPAVRELEIRVLADPVARLNAVTSGEIDATTIDANQVAAAEAEPGLSIQLESQLRYYYLVQNRAKAGQDDVRVRQALVHAIDREGICETLLFGYCELSDQPFPPGYYANDDSIDQVLYPYDPDRARALLEEAGVTDLQLSVLTPAGLAEYQSISEVIQAQWAEVGVTASLTAHEPSTMADVMFVDLAHDAMVAGNSGRLDPSSMLLGRVSADAYANPGGHTTPEFDELLAESISTSDLDERSEVLKAASREVAESVLEIPILYPQLPYVTREGVTLVPAINSITDFRHVAVSE